DLLPQREISRHVQRAPPYDGQRVVLHPMSPFGLTRTGRAPSLYVVELALNHRLRLAFPTCPQALIPVPEWVPIAMTTLGIPSSACHHQPLTPSSKSGAKTSHPSL